MTDDQIQKLIKFLADLKFTGVELEQKLKEKIAQGPSTFMLSHNIAYPDASMSFQLKFKKDLQFDAYRFTEYDAFLKNNIPIGHQEINGIDTAKLEDSFKSVDWNLYFNDARGKINESQRLEFQALLSDLWQLTSRESVEGSRIQSVLQYKYWPDHAWDNETKDLLKIFHKGRMFSVSENGAVNADLAFNILSGRFDDLQDKLSYSGLANLSRVDLYSPLDEALSATPDKFALVFEDNQQEAFARYTVPVGLIDELYYIEGYSVQVIPHPEIEHRTINGIDTAELEYQMKEMNWRDSNVLDAIYEEWGPVFQPEVEHIREQLLQLSENSAGTDIANTLMLRYWSGIKNLNDEIPEAAYQLLDTFPSIIKEFPVEFNAPAAYNLLCGRAVLSQIEYEETRGTDVWLSLDYTKRETDNTPSIVKTVGPTVTELETQIAALPVSNDTLDEIKMGMMDGDVVKATLRNGQTVAIKMDIAFRGIKIFTPQMIPIPVNIHFDPDWIAPLKSENAAIEQKQTYHKYKMPGPVKNRKGKRL